MNDFAQEGPPQLLELEDELKEALDDETAKQRVVAMTKLEGVLTGVLDVVARGDRRDLRRAVRRSLPAPRRAPDADARYHDLWAAMHMAETEHVSPPEQLRPQVQGQPQPNLSHLSTEQLNLLSSTLGKDGAPQVDTMSPPPPLPPAGEATGAAAAVAAGGSTTSDKPRAASRAPRAPLFGIRFVSFPPSADLGLGEASEAAPVKRSRMVDNTIEVNVDHPDFQTRVRMRRGRPRITERLGAYLSAVISSHYRDHWYTEHGKDPPRAQLYEDMLSTLTQLEAALRRRLPGLQRALAEEWASAASKGAQEGGEGGEGEAEQESGLESESELESETTR